MRLNNCCKFTNHDYLLLDMYKYYVVVTIISIIIIISLFKPLQIVYFSYVFANYLRNQTTRISWFLLLISRLFKACFSLKSSS